MWMSWFALVGCPQQVDCAECVAKCPAECGEKDKEGGPDTVEIRQVDQGSLGIWKKPGGRVGWTVALLPEKAGDAAHLEYVAWHGQLDSNVDLETLQTATPDRFPEFMLMEVDTLTVRCESAPVPLSAESKFRTDSEIEGQLSRIGPEESPLGFRFVARDGWEEWAMIAGGLPMDGTAVPIQTIAGAYVEFQREAKKLAGARAWGVVTREGPPASQMGRHECGWEPVLGRDADFSRLVHDFTPPPPSPPARQTPG